VCTVFASAFLWGAVLPHLMAAGPEEATNPTPSQPADANTPTHASQNADDTRVTQQIHGALMTDASLSAAARQIDVRTNGDAIVLRGSVTTQEKDRIVQVVGQYAGARQVDSQLTIRDF
jgi:osmotically-inducible protein OsmY